MSAMKPNNKDIELLSAYLDQQLDANNEKKLKQRLGQDAGLRQALEDIRLTRYALRHTPKIRRPRSFTLSPEVVKQQRSVWRALNFSRTVAVAAGVLFAVLVGGDMLLGRGPIAMQSAAPADAYMEAYDMADDAEGMPMAAAPEEEAMEMEMAMEDAIEEEPAADEASDGENVGEAAPPVEETMPPLAAEAAPTADMRMMDEDETEEDAEQPVMIPDEKVDEPLGGGDETPQRKGVPVIRWVQGGLLAMTALFFLLARFFRRKAV